MATKDKPEGTKTKAQIALHLAEEQCSGLFLDQFGAPYAAIKVGRHIETLPLKSSRFRHWLCRIYYTSEQDVLNGEICKLMLERTRSETEFDGAGRNLSLRVASNPDEPSTIYYDLTNKDWQVVKITENDWSIEYAPGLFRRYSNQCTEAHPCKSKDYPPDIFDKFMRLINVKDGKLSYLLNATYIVIHS